MNRAAPRPGASLPLFGAHGGPPQRRFASPHREPAGFLPSEARARLADVPEPVRGALARLYPTEREDAEARRFHALEERRRWAERNAELKRKTERALAGGYGAEVRLRARALVAGGVTLQAMLEVERVVRDAAMQARRNRRRGGRR